MNIRPGTAADLDSIIEIDSVIESNDYLHVDRTGEGLSLAFTIEQRPMREKLVEPNRLIEDKHFAVKQVLTGVEDGKVLIADHDDHVIGALVSQNRPENSTVELIDLRVDYDFRRQGIATVLVCQMIEAVKEQDIRAIYITTLTNNSAAAALLQKLGFELSGLDLRRQSNHDLVKEAVTLHWYYEMP